MHLVCALRLAGWLRSNDAGYEMGAFGALLLVHRKVGEGKGRGNNCIYITIPHAPSN